MAGKQSYFKTFIKVSDAFGTSTDMDVLLQMIVDSAIETLKAKAACLFLADEELETFKAVAERGLSPDYLHAGYGHAEKIIPILKKDGFIYYQDAATDKRLENRDRKKAEGIGSILVVPAMVKGELIAVLTVYTAKKREFHPDEIEFLQLIAGQGGWAIQVKKLVDQLRSNTKIFLNLAADIAASLDIKAILQTLTKEVAQALRVKAASIRLLNDERTVLQLVASYGLSEKYLQKGPISAEKSIAEALNGKPVAIADASTDKGVQYKKEKKEEGIVSILCVPIKAKEEVIGVLRLYSDKKREFTEDEVELVTALAYQGGLAIQNASLYLMLQNDLRDMKEATWTYKCWF
ncbi:MAG: GAF domain-containing protein [Syntrophobacterales bacterium]|nr:GAF domain-containing protein [Syntrophobacterales bacterium]